MSGNGRKRRARRLNAEGGRASHFVRTTISRLPCARQVLLRQDTARQCKGRRGKAIRPRKNTRSSRIIVNFFRPRLLLFYLPSSTIRSAVQCSVRQHAIEPEEKTKTARLEKELARRAQGVAPLMIFLPLPPSPFDFQFFTLVFWSSRPCSPLIFLLFL